MSDDGFIGFGEDDLDPAVSSLIGGGKPRPAKHPNRPASPPKPPSQSEPETLTQRKRRADFKGSKPADYHVGSKVLAVRLPEEQAEEVKKRAKTEGLSVNAWLSEQIMALLKPAKKRK